MSSEHEMCPNCKRDIPLSVYTTHTAHCARNFVMCKDCGETIERFDMVEHKRNAHAIMVCDQCGVKVEARKLNDHRSFLCPRLLLVCKYCDLDVPASKLSEHEAQCGAETDRCPHCEESVRLRDLDKHMSHFHGLYLQRSQSRSRRESSLAPRSQSSQGVEWTNNPQNTDTSAMLPCEFCEGLVPIHKLLEHQADCVNPSNVRGSSTLLSPPVSTSSSFANGLSRSQSMVSQDWLQIPNGRIKVVRRQTSAAESQPHHQPNEIQRPSRRASRAPTVVKDDEPFQRPCHICNQMIPTERIERHQMTCVKMPDSGHAIRAASITRTLSAREARATTEERSFRSSSVYRQSSFTERSFRRAESLSRQPAPVSRPSRYSSLYGSTYSHDYVSASRRSTIYNGYSGFAMYSSISQGLDEISYGGRLSRRNSISSESRRPSAVSPSTSNADYSLPTLLATYEATTKSSSSNSGRASSLSRQSSIRAENHKSSQEKPAKEVKRSSESISTKDQQASAPRRGDLSVSRQDSCRQKDRSSAKRDDKHNSGSLSTSTSSNSIKRKVSFHDRDLKKIGVRAGEDRSNTTDSPAQEGVLKPRRIRKDPNKERKSTRTKKRDKSQDIGHFEDKRRSQPMGDELFAKVSTKLKEVERERNRQEACEQRNHVSLEDASTTTAEPQSPLSPHHPMKKTQQPEKRDEVQKMEEQRPAVLPDPRPTFIARDLSFSDDLKMSGETWVVSSSSEGHHNDKASSTSLAALFESGYSSTAASLASMPNEEIKSSRDSFKSPTAISRAADRESEGFYPVYSSGPTFEQDRAFGESSAGSSKATTSSEASPQQKPRQNRNGLTTAGAAGSDEPILRRRYNPEGSDSKSSSKRNSLEGKTVQTLAQDLAAECAKAYALMESSLSKLSTEFAVGPFGITPRQKKQRKSQTTSSASQN